MNTDRNRFRLPPFECKQVVQQFSELLDWSIKFGGIPEAWKQSRGKGVRVAILDTGVDYKHPDLAGAIVETADFSGSIIGVSDANAHGTWCAGMIGARANDIGVRGLMPECDLLIGKVLGDDGSGSEDMIRAGFEWAASRGADIISMSLGGGRMSEQFHDAIQRFCLLPERFVIAAAGNDGRDNSVNYPAKWEECVAVGAVDRNGKLTDFTSRGPEIDILAPGHDMISTIPTLLGSYGKMSGTSMATPYVAGVAGLALAKHRTAGGNSDLKTYRDLLAHLKKTAKQDPSGYGIINPVGLMDEVIGGVPGDLPPIFSGAGVIVNGKKYRPKQIIWEEVTE